MMNETMMISIQMESLKTELYQNTIILENKAVKELGLGMITPNLVNLITEVYTNKATLIGLEMLKNGQQPDANTIINYLLANNQSPVMINIINQNQMLPTVANNCMIKLNNIQQEAVKAAKMEISKQTMRGNNMYMQQPTMQYSGMGNMVQQPMMGSMAPMVAQSMGNTIYPNMMQQQTQPQNLMNSGVYSAKYAEAKPQATPIAPIVTAPSNNKYNTPVKQEPTKVIPAEAIPTEKKSFWLCAPGVSINANGDAIGNVQADLILNYDPHPLEETLETADALKACLFKATPDTLKKFTYRIKKRKFTTSDRFNSLVTKCLSYYTSKTMAAISTTAPGTLIDDIITDKAALLADLTNKIVVIKDRADTEAIVNKLADEAVISKALVQTENSPINNSFVELNYSEDRPTYLLTSDRLLEALKGVEKAFDAVISISPYSYPGVFNSLSKVIQEEGGFLDLFVGSVNGYMYLTMYQKAPNTDIKFVVVESNIK